MKHTLRLLCLAALAMQAACIAPKKFQALQEQHAACEENAAQLEQENQSLQKQKRNQQATTQQLSGRIVELQDTIGLLQEEKRALDSRYADLMKMQETTQAGSKQEIRQLLEQLQQNREALLDKESMLGDMDRALGDRTRAVQQLERDLTERNQKLVALQQALAQKDSVARALRKKVADALLGFEGKGLTVSMRDGKVYVSLDEQLLFASGSFVVDTRGAEAIQNLAKVLEQNPDINVAIEGHTDDVPYNGAGQLQDNWDLSVKRATSVVRIMLRNKGIAQSRITASGRAEFVPLKKEKTTEARQANRRIEVILAPKLDEVFKMLDQ